MPTHLVHADNARFSLGEIRTEFDPTASAVERAQAVRQATDQAFTVACARLFCELDVEGFWRGLRAMSRTWEVFLTESVATADIATIPASLNSGLLAAIALGDPKQALAIAERSNMSRVDGEYPGEFHGARFFQVWSTPSGSWEATADRLRDVAMDLAKNPGPEAGFVDFALAISDHEDVDIVEPFIAWAETEAEQALERAALPSAAREAQLTTALGLKQLAVLRMVESRGGAVPLGVPRVPDLVRIAPESPTPGEDLFHASFDAQQGL